MTLETMQAVVEKLVALEVPATLEYPGAIYVNAGAGTLICGDANEFFACDVSVAEGVVTETLDSEIPSDSTDVTAVADFVSYAYTAAFVLGEAGLL